MFSRDNVVRFTIEAVILAIVSVIIIVLGVIATNSNEYSVSRAVTMRITIRFLKRLHMNLYKARLSQATAE